MCVLETRCSCLWFAWNRHLHSRNHSWRCPGRRRAGFPSHQSSELCMPGARPQIHRSRQERLSALFLLAGCVASHLVLLSGSSSSCAEDRKKTSCMCSVSSSRGSRANRHSPSNVARNLGASKCSSVCPRRPGSTSLWSEPMFRCVQCKFGSNRSELGRVGVSHKCGRSGSTHHPKERAAINQKPFSRFSWGARVAAVVLRSNMQKPKRTALQPGHLSVLTARV
jgi:hypothetical protein